MERLKAYLDRPSKVPRELGYHALQGFIFGMITGPFVAETRQWTILLLPEMDDETHDEFCDLYYDIERGVTAGTPTLPADCPLAPDPLGNLDPDSPVSQWARGFFKTQTLFPHVWVDFYRAMASWDATTTKAFGRAHVHLNFFSSRQVADLTANEGTPRRTLAEIAAEAQASFEADMATYAMCVRPWRERVARAGPEHRPAKSPGTSGDPKAHLKAFLARPSNPPGVLSYHALRGFMFAVVCAPKVVEPHEWLGLVLGEAMALLLYGEEGRIVMNEMRDLYHEIEARVARGVVALPPDCPMAPEPMANLDPASPLSQWSQGFYAAHNWLAFEWMLILKTLIKEDPGMAKEVGRATMHLTFFVSPHLANEVWKLWEQDTLEGLAAQAHRDFKVGMVCYASIGRGFRDGARRAEADAARSPSGARRTATARPTVGRNQPCSCGSGKKYKKCCGAVH